MRGEDKCPTCGCATGINIGVHSSAEYANLHSHDLGGINYLIACAECGTVYLPLHYRESFERKHKEKHAFRMNMKGEIK